MAFIPLPVKVPALVKKLYPDYLWDKYAFAKGQKKLYLTFDDGPIPEVTPWVLETLGRYEAKATFFCIGENISKHPDIFEQLKNSENRIGNHTYNHINGWETETEVYIENTKKAEGFIGSEDRKNKPLLFRPPYGKIKRAQANGLKELGYQIVMYDVVAYDWDASVSPEKCLNNVIKNSRNGSIIVFHDSFKARKNMQFALPQVLSHFGELGYSFEVL